MKYIFNFFGIVLLSCIKDDDKARNKVPRRRRRRIQLASERYANENTGSERAIVSDRCPVTRFRSVNTSAAFHMAPTCDVIGVKSGNQLCRRVFYITTSPRRNGAMILATVRCLSYDGVSQQSRQRTFTWTYDRCESIQGELNVAIRSSRLTNNVVITFILGLVSVIQYSN